MSHIYRAYYAVRGLTNKQGLPTNAIYGFTSMLRKLIKEERPEYLGVAIDLSGPTVRHEQYQDYKSTRKPMPPDLVEQIPYIHRVCEVLCIPILSYDRYEADDVIGTLACKALEHDLEVVIVTIDKDMFQLVNGRITVLDTRTMTRLGPQEVEKKIGVPPDRVLDVLSLVGDSSDNIPGAPGIGEKGAQQLIQEHGSLEALLANRDQVSRKTYRESLQQNEELIRRSRELMVIHRNLPLELDLKDLEFCDPDYEKARELFSELEFTSLLEEFLPERPTAQTVYRCIESVEALKPVIESLEGRNASMSLIYDNQDYLRGPLKGISICTRPHEAWLLPREAIEQNPEETSWLLGKPAKWIIHDLKPFYFFAQRYGWEIPRNLYDTMLMAYLLSPNQNNFSAERLSLEFLKHGLSPIPNGQEELFRDGHLNALCERADAAFQLFEILHPQIVEKHLQDLLHDIEIPLVRVLALMERNGVKVDPALLGQMSCELESQIADLISSIYSMAGQEFNLNSPRQLAEVLFEKLNLPMVRKTRKAGHLATGVEVLEELAQTYDIARLILEYRELSKLKNTYLDALPKLINPHTGRIHTSYNQMVAATGRLSSSNPNLQNIPIKSELGRRIRRAFIAEPDWGILAADYSQIELRIMAHLSQDPVLLDSFRKGQDIHERTAREVFGINAVLNPQEFRRPAKVINFGIMYGLSAFGLSQNLKIERKVAQQYIDDYFLRYKGVQEWIERTLEGAREKGYVSTLFGRIRQIPEIHSKNWNLRNFGERTAINAPIQGTAADLIKKAMVSIDSEMSRLGLRSKMIMQVHDELVFEVPEAEIEQMKALVRRQMESVASLSVPLQVDLGLGPSWYSAK